MFKTGDVVQLKSGGALMTVSEIEGNVVHCRWQAATEEKTSSYASEMLQLANTGPKFLYVPNRNRRR